MGFGGASPVVLVVKFTPANTGDVRDTGLIPGLGSSPGGGYGNPFQYSFLENPISTHARMGLGEENHRGKVSFSLHHMINMTRHC